MKNFFLKISDEKIAVLEDVGFADFCTFTIDSSNGIIVDEENIVRVLNLLEMKIETEEKTSYEGIFLANLSVISEDNTGNSKVKTKDWNGDNRNTFREITKRILFPVVKKNITISVPHGNTISPSTEDDHFHIWIWSSPNGEASGKVPEKIWRKSVACRDNGFLPSGQGISIEDEETGWVVAELVGDNLYIHHDICHHGKDSEKEIFSIVLEKVVEELSISEKEREKREKEKVKRRLELQKTFYVKECSKRLEQTLQSVREKIRNGEENIKQLQKDIVHNIREVTFARRRLEQLQKNNGLEEYGLEFDKLKTVKGVKDVLVTDGVIKVFTNTLFCTDPRTDILHDIGAFRIEIYTDGSKNGVRWFNLNRQVYGYNDRKMQAPHVFKDGHACMGNTEEIFPELIANYEFAAVAMVAIQFIESVNVDDAAGKFIDRWPKASVRKEKRKDA